MLLSSSDLMSVLVGMTHVISMPTLLVAMTVNVCQVSWEMDSIVQVSIYIYIYIIYMF